MKVAIVGGSGTIGQAIAARLLERGDMVTIASRSTGGDGSVRGATWRRYDPMDPTSLPPLLDGHDAVINLAGTPVGPRPWTTARKRAIRASRIDTTTAIVVALAVLPADRRPAVLVSASGTDRYTGLPGDPATEDVVSADGFLADVCRDWEAAATRATDLGLRVVTVRIGFVLGQAGHILPILALPFRLFIGGPIGSGRQWMSWIHLDDVADVFVVALDDPRYAGPVNAVAPEPVRQGDLASAISNALHRPAWLPVPASLVRLVMGDQATLILDSRRIAPARLDELGFRHRWTDLGAAVADALGGRRR